MEAGLFFFQRRSEKRSKNLIVPSLISQNRHRLDGCRPKGCQEADQRCDQHEYEAGGQNKNDRTPPHIIKQASKQPLDYERTGQTRQDSKQDRVRSLFDNHAESIGATGTDRHANSDLSGTQSNLIVQQAIDANYGKQKGKRTDGSGQASDKTPVR